MKDRAAFLLVYSYSVGFLAVVLTSFIVVLYELVWGLWQWRDMVTLLVTFHCLGVGVTVFYHRYFTHHAFLFTPAGKWLARPLIAWSAMAAWLGPPKVWAALHERHHQGTDVKGKDPHGPIYGLVDFFYVALALYAPRLNKTVDFDGYAARHDPHYDWFERRVCGKVGYVVLGMFLPCAVALYFKVLVWYFAGVGIVFVGVNTVNSVGHCGEFFSRLPRLLRGVCSAIFLQNHHTAHCGDSLNVRPWAAWLGGYFTAGEINHNNHHRYPTSAQIGSHWYDSDLGWWLIWTLEKAHLVRRVRRQSGATTNDDRGTFLAAAAESVAGLPASVGAR